MNGIDMVKNFIQFRKVVAVCTLCGKESAKMKKGWTGNTRNVFRYVLERGGEGVLISKEMMTIK